MSFEEFRESLKGGAPPDLGPALRGLWWEAKGEWDRAHDAAQEDGGRECSRVHAYLHRKEGDLSNAGYWYSRSGEAMPSGGLDEEWADLVRRLLGGSS